MMKILEAYTYQGAVGRCKAEVYFVPPVFSGAHKTRPGILFCRAGKNDQPIGVDAGDLQELPLYRVVNTLAQATLEAEKHFNRKVWGIKHPPFED